MPFASAAEVSRTRPLRASIWEPTGIDSACPRGTNLLLPGTFTRTVPLTSVITTVFLATGAGLCAVSPSTPPSSATGAARVVKVLSTPAAGPPALNAITR